MRTPFPRRRHAPSTLQELCPIATPLPSLSKLQKALPEGGTATPPQEDGAMFDLGGGLAATAPPASNNAIIPTTHPNLHDVAFICPPFVSLAPRPALYVASGLTDK